MLRGHRGRNLEVRTNFNVIAPLPRLSRHRQTDGRTDRQRQNARCRRSPPNLTYSRPCMSSWARNNMRGSMRANDPALRPLPSCSPWRSALICPEEAGFSSIMAPM